jgi:hypothetical protein
MNLASSFLHHLTFKEFVVKDVAKNIEVGQYGAREDEKRQ